MVYFIPFLILSSLALANPYLATETFLCQCEKKFIPSPSLSVSKLNQQHYSILRGLETLNKLYTNPDQVIQANITPADAQSQNKRLNNIIDLISAIYEIAIRKDGCFNSGAVVLDDPSEAIFDFLFQYVLMINPNVKKKTANIQSSHSLFRSKLNHTREKLFYSLPKFSSAYQRFSSHLSDQYTVQYGIELPKNVLGSFPFQKKHLLFFQILSKDKTPRIYLKLENHGLSTTHFSHHAKNYIQHLSPFRKDEKISKRETLTKEMKELYGDFVNNLKNYLKNANITKNASQLQINDYTLVKETLNNLSHKPKWLQKLIYSYYSLNNLQSPKGRALYAHLQTILFKLSKIKGETIEQLANRFGNEVVLPYKTVMHSLPSLLRIFQANETKLMQTNKNNFNPGRQGKDLNELSY